MQSDILIIGAGPTGMVAALCFSKLDISCTIIEKQSQISIHPKAHELNARSIEILEQLGITVEELLVEAAPLEDSARILFCNTINSEFGRLEILAEEERAANYELHLKFTRPFLNLSQTILEQILRKHIQNKENITFLREYEWEDFTETAGQITNKVKNYKTGEIISIESKYLLAADGAASKIREKLNIEMIGPRKLQDFLSIYFEANLKEIIKTPAKLYFLFNPECAGTFIAHHIEKRWVFHIPILTPYEKTESFTEEILAKRISKALEVEHIDFKILSTSFWRMSSQIASAFQKGNIFLIGDAAHRFPPTGGLGMNSGIGDAHNLAWKIKSVLQGEAKSEILNSYEVERRPIVSRNCEESQTNYFKLFELVKILGLDYEKMKLFLIILNSAPVKWLGDSFKAKVLNFGVKLAQKTLENFSADKDKQAEFQKSLNAQISHFDRLGLDIGYTYESGIIIPESNQTNFALNQNPSIYIPTTKPGARLPHFWLSKNSVPVSSHSLIDYSNFVVLLGASAKQWESALENLQSNWKIPFRVVKIDTLNMESTLNIYEKLQIEEDGLLIIRPDGHIFYRSKNSLNVTAEIAKILSFF